MTNEEREASDKLIEGDLRNCAATDPIVKFFSFGHLPPHLRDASRPFAELAQWLVMTFPRNAERTTALRKLLEAKDCAVRSTLP